MTFPRTKSISMVVLRPMLVGSVLLGSVQPLLAKDEASATTEARESAVYTGGLKDETMGIRPELGLLNFKDADGGATSRGAIGVAYDMNLAKSLTSISRSVYAGISTGAVYSHIGDAGSNFFGSNSGVTAGNAGGNLFLFPVNLKAGYNFTDHFRLSAHGGGNILYASVPGAISPELGDRVGSKWSLFPNLGADLDYGVARNIAITLRPDWIFSSGVGFFAGMLQIGMTFG